MLNDQYKNAGVISQKLTQRTRDDFKILKIDSKCFVFSQRTQKHWKSSVITIVWKRAKTSCIQISLNQSKTIWKDRKQFLLKNDNIILHSGAIAYYTNV